MISNNVTRMLDSLNVKFSTFELPHDKLGALETAAYLSVPVELIYKSIVVTRSNGKPLICIVPGDCDVNLKAVSSLAGEKKVTIPTLVEAEKLTGLKAGGISPLALMNKGFDFFLDISSLEHQEIHISGGQRGLNIKLMVTDLIKILNPKIAAIAGIKHLNDK